MIDWVSLLFNNQTIIYILSAIAGIVVTLVTQRLLNRRGLFTYSVSHNKIGVSADDSIFGEVRVTWNNNPIHQLFFSTIELINRSFNDYQSVVVSAYSSDTSLYTEKTEIVDSASILFWTKEFEERLGITEGEAPTPAQVELFAHRRDYLVPVFNRGQSIRLSFLNSAENDKGPSIWLDIVHPGIKIKFRPRSATVFGVPQSTAAVVGMFSGLVLISLVIMVTNNVIIAAIISFFLGLVAQVPGAYMIKAWHKLRDWVAG